MASAAESVGTVEAAIAHAIELLEQRPELALLQAREIAKASPGHPIASFIEGSAARRLGDVDAALAILEPLARSQPRAPAVHLEYGLALGAAGRGEAAIAALRHAIGLNAALPGAWRALADHLAATGDAAAADRAYAQHIRAATRDPRLLRPAAALVENDIPLAESLLREHLKQSPTDVAAIRMLAEVAARLRRLGDAERLLARCLELAPSFSAARLQYASVLNRQNRPSEALRQVEQLLAEEPRNPNYRNLKASVLVGVGEYEQAIELYRAILAEYPNQAKVWMSCGHILKTAGRQDEAIRAYRKAVELAPTLGEAYWSLANLKTYSFTGADLDAMQAQLAGDSLSIEDRWHFEFALGKACEDAEQFDASFAHYREGNRLRRSQIQYDPSDHSQLVRRSRKLFSSEFLRERAGWGSQAADPIFIVGLPRAGSTLIEQILASHPLVEGTMELYDVISLARSLAEDRREGFAAYPQMLADLSAERLRELGERYLAATRIQRKTDAPYFIDKMPNNVLHVGLIHLMLPNARIIDARRHPLGCCFSAYKQHFARGQHFSYDLEDVARYYRDYVELMAHFDRVLPGRIHRVVYEELIGNTEQEVRRLLEYCRLPFDRACLRFHENTRAVRTASSEQVRKPIYREGLEQWRNYERWLEPMKAVLGPVLTAYPAVPESLAAPE